MKQALKVGIFATICLIILAVLVWKIEDLNPFKQKGQKLDAVFDSVAGLDDKATVRIAGVRVGRVDGVGLAGRRARVSIVLEKPMDLTEGTHARIASLGLLGEKYVELIPGPAGAPRLPPGAVLPGITPPSFDDAMAQLSEIGASVQKVTGSLAGGDLGGSINGLVGDLRAEAVGRGVLPGVRLATDPGLDPQRRRVRTRDLSTQREAREEVDREAFAGDGEQAPERRLDARARVLGVVAEDAAGDDVVVLAVGLPGERQIAETAADLAAIQTAQSQSQPCIAINTFLK